MSKSYANFDCECGSQTRILYIVPSYFVPTVSTFNCSGCETRYQYSINKLKSDRTKIELHSKIIHLSDTLRLLRMESNYEEMPDTP